MHHIHNYCSPVTEGTVRQSRWRIKVSRGGRKDDRTGITSERNWKCANEKGGK
jgi:hypothetical protein